MKLRQVAIAAEQLEPVRGQLFELLGIEQDFADPGVGEFGLENSVMAIGDSFLEIVAPIQANTAAGRTVEKRGGTCGYMVLMQVEDFAAYAQHLNAQKVRQIWSAERSEVSACHVHPKDIGGAIVSFDEMRPPESWLWAGPNWTQQRATNVTRILSCTLTSPDPSALARRWGEIMQTPVTNTTAEDGAEAVLAFEDGTSIRFNAGLSDQGITDITFGLADPEMRATIQDKATALDLIQQNSDVIRFGGVTIHFAIDG